MSEKPTINSLSFTELVALRNNLFDQMKLCEDTQFIPKLDSIDKHKNLKDDYERLDSFIYAKYSVLKNNSIKKT